VRDNLFYHTELAGERDHPLNAIRHLVEAFEVRFIELCDRNGRVVANTEYPSMYDIDRSSNPLIRNALSGSLSVGIERQERGFLLMAVSPIYYYQDQLIGTITTGIRMDNSFAQRIKSLSGVELAIVDKSGNIVASTLQEIREGGRISTDTGTLSIKDRRYLLIKLPLSDHMGILLGHVVIMSEDKLPGIIRNVHITVTLLLGLIAVASITATVIILRKVLSPVKRLKEGAERIGRGDFHHRIDVSSRDEIGSLAEVFNRMAENLQNIHEIEERLRHSERLASIGRFTAGIAHEINNPIANIIGMMKIIRRGISEDDPLREEIDILLKEANRCGAIVRDLLLYSRQSPPKKESVDINRLIDDVLRSVEHSLDGKDIDIRRELDTTLPQVQIDSIQIEQVVRNLVLNAIQSIDSSGTVTVKTVSGDPDLVIEISDTGCGIRKEDVDRIFYPFFTTKKTGEGNGLGLTVSYGIIQGHGGDITVETEYGKGSIFRVTLPIGELNG
jgi:signal transduction histidine kinase